MDFAQTKIKVGEIQQCLRCKLDIKITKIALPERNESDSEELVGIEPYVTNGVEIESYLIKNCEILERSHIIPNSHVIEPGESFTEDQTIGNEYISPVFDDINEGLFLLKNGLRKYRAFTEDRVEYQIGLFGSWLKDPAGTHIHIALGELGIEKEIARGVMIYLHDYLPLIIALSVNSPVYPGHIRKKPRLTSYPSNRLLKYGNTHCKSISKIEIEPMASDHWVEINYNAYRKDKPPTIEIRVADSNIPEYVMACVLVLRVLTMAKLCGKSSPNILSYKNFLKSKRRAIRSGVRGSLYWDNRKMRISTYIDKFFDYFHEEIDNENPNDEILNVFRLAKLGWNNAVIMSHSIKAIKTLYSSKKFSWRRQFLQQYCEAISSLLNGNNLSEFAQLLFVNLPSYEEVELGVINPF